jgi:hypothetical protein
LNCSISGDRRSTATFIVLLDAIQIKTMARILVELVGETIDIEDLKFGLRLSPWKIIKEQDRFFLTSAILDSLNDSEEVIAEAEEYLELLNGSANIFYYNHRNVHTGSLIKEDDNGGRNITVFPGAAEIRTRLRGTLSVAGQNLDNSPTTTEEWINKAANNEKVRDALRFFNNKTWWGLYKVFDVIQEEEGYKNLSKFASKDEINRFHQTAQSRDAIGDDARHGKKIAPPPNPMNLKEGHQFVKSLFENWVKSK